MTSDAAVLDHYLGTVSWPGAPGTFTVFSDDTSILSQNPQSWGFTGQSSGCHQGTWGMGAETGEGRFTNFPIMICGAQHWSIGVANNGGRWECDDFKGPKAGYWYIYVR